MTGPIILVAGARPNFMKIAPLHKELVSRSLDVILVHTGQHYDTNMSQIFFDELGIPEPDIHLNVGSGSHAVQTAAVMVAFEKVCLENSPSMVVVVGDVNSTMACTIVAAKLHIPCAHVEAGLRSGDMEMPEEVNRVLTDRICEILLTPSPDGDENLRKEGTEESRIHLVGNIMIDTLFNNLAKVDADKICESLGLEKAGFCLLTMHRPSNVDDEATLTGIVGALLQISESIPIVMPLHPRTTAKLNEFGLMESLHASEAIKISEPLGYLDFIGLVSASRFVLTDSGGIQEETTALGIPCLTMRHNTERPITVSEGTNKIVGNDPGKILSEVEDILATGGKAGQVPDLWDGKTAARMVDVIMANLENRK